MQMRRSFRQLETQQHASEYVERLSREWPERAQICRHAVQQVERVAAQLHEPAPRVLELCSGPGVLAQSLLSALPTLHYVGIDLSPVLLEFARQQLQSHAARTTFLQANLNEGEWLTVLARADATPFHAVVTVQSLHDLGGEAEVARIYSVAQQLLAPGGLFLNADLVVAPGEERPTNPGRRSVTRHLELLSIYGYTNVANPLSLGEFGCVVGYRPL